MKMPLNDDNNFAPNSLSSDEVKKIEEFRKSKQTAILSILFSDIVNSTYATEKLGEQAYSKLRHIHDELFRKIMCRDNAGIIIKEIGDSFLCVFAEPSTAVLRSIEFQRAINSNKDHLTIQNYTLSVRIGIHVGQVAVENAFAKDIFGRHVNRTARIESMANGGQILTSLSVWENAVGWLNDSKEDKIGWISHGKIKLKGVEEKVEIFEFYSKDITKPSPPTFVHRRRNNQLLWLSLIFGLLAGSYFVIKGIGSETSVPQKSVRKAYYVQFDFSEISRQIKKSRTPIAFDSADIADRVLSLAIYELTPDSVVTEADLIKSFSRKGKLYQRHSTPNTFNKSDNGDDHRYFRDTLNLAGVMLFEVSPLSNMEKNSIIFSYKFAYYFDSGSSFENSPTNLDLEYIEDDFRSVIQGALRKAQLQFVQGYVLTSDDNVIIFKLSKNAKLRQGASISLSRNYSGKEGLQERLEYIKSKIEYFKKQNDSSELKDTYEHYTKIEKSIPSTTAINNNAFGLDIRGRVTELYDSTAKATWKVNGKFLLEKPKEGDLIYIAY